MTGPSGSGKSTLLGLLAGLDRPTRGTVMIDGHDLAASPRTSGPAFGRSGSASSSSPSTCSRRSPRARTSRCRSSCGARTARARADELLARVGLGGRGHHYPAQLSGGEQQRVAVARAFANRPKLLFADEPTGNLDAANGQNVVALLCELNREQGHDARAGHPRPRARRASAPRHPPARRRPGRGRRPRRGSRLSSGVLRPAPRVARVPGLAAPAACSSCWRWPSARPPSSPSTRSRDNLRESVRREARALLGADLALSAAAPFSPAAEAVLAEVRAATSPPAEVARGVSFGAMALRPGGQTTRLAQVRAVDPGYPFYGLIETSPPGEWARLGETGGAVADASLLVALGARVGDEIALGEARFVMRATVENMPGRRRRPQRLRPARLHPPRAGRGDGPALPRLAGQPRGLPEAAARERRPGDRRPLPLPALRRAPQRPHRLGRPAAPHRHPLPLRQLPRPRGPGGAAARRPRRRQRRARLHQAAPGHGGRPALPRRHRRHRPRRLPRPGGVRGPPRQPRWARRSGPGSSWRSPAC